MNIEGFKSIGKINLIEPNPFSVFVGPNASGKSNIFEALEFLELCNNISPKEVVKLFGSENAIVNQAIILNDKHEIKFEIELDKIITSFQIEFESNGSDSSIFSMVFGNFSARFYRNTNWLGNSVTDDPLAFSKDPNYIAFTNFSRLFVGERDSKVKIKNQDDSRLISDGSNLEKVLKRILKNEQDRDEIGEILQLLIPGFENVEIRTEELSGSDNLLIYESSLKKPINKHIISDGTYNVLALIAAIYQSAEPQFLCIEEPENGLNPKMVRELVKLFRDKCKEKGHYIWLNTHSQTLVAELTPDEIILVDKVNGNTVTKQIKGMDLQGMRMDEALLTNALGGGIPW